MSHHLLSTKFIRWPHPANLTDERLLQLTLMDELDSISFWSERNRILFGGTSMHVALWALIALIGISGSAWIGLHWPKVWYLTFNMFTLPSLYAFVNWRRYYQNDYW